MQQCGCENPVEGTAEPEPGLTPKAPDFCLSGPTDNFKGQLMELWLNFPFLRVWVHFLYKNRRIRPDASLTLLSFNGKEGYGNT